MPSDDDTGSYSGSRGGREPFDIGNAFRDGRAEIMGRTEANGWKKEVSVRLPNGEWRKLDIARLRNGRVDNAVENKVAKRINPSRELFEQLRKDVVLAKEFGIKSDWELSGKIPKSVADALERANRETRGLVTLVRVTRAERNAAFQRAQELARDKARGQKQALARYMQRLRSARERQDRAKQRERDEREAHVKQRARERLPTIRAIAKAKDRAERVRNMGRYLDGSTVGRDDVAKRTEAARREAAERAEREREARERQQQREAADRLAQAAQQAREAAANGQVRAMDGREAADLLRISRPTPGAESPYREPPQARQTREGREERGRERGIERDRQ